MTWLASCALARSVPASPAGERYAVEIHLDRPLRAHVVATITIANGELHTGEGGADQLPRHWGSLVSHLSVKRTSGESLAVTPLDTKDASRGEWSVAGHYGGPAVISYDVDLEFAANKWEPTNDKAGYFDGRALFVVTKPLFVASTASGPIDVSFDLPAGAKLATPWRADGRVAHVPTLGDLLQNTIVVGDFVAERFHAGNFEFTLAMLGRMRDSSAIAATTMRAFAEFDARLFPDTPPSGYLLTIFDGDEENGESYARSAAFVTTHPLTEDTKIMWGTTQGHEMFHLWCGSQIDGIDSDRSQWFIEGFTEYYADLALLREQIVPPELFVKKLENMIGKYVYFRTAPQFSKVSIEDSGTRKTTYRFGVYNGGWAVAFGMDMTIRTATHGKRSLDDFMRLVYDRFGLTGKKASYDDLVAAAVDVGGDAMRDVFAKYVRGVEVMPMSAWLTDLGYEALVQDYAAEIYIRDVGATPLRRAWASP